MSNRIRGSLFEEFAKHQGAAAKQLAKIVHNKIVKGRPLEVQLEVNKLLEEGYEINSEMFQWTMPGTGEVIFVQQLILREDIA